MYYSEWVSGGGGGASSFLWHYYYIGYMNRFVAKSAVLKVVKSGSLYAVA